jgi:hypothetical protein
MGLFSPRFLWNAARGTVMLSSTAEQLQLMGCLLQLRRGTPRARAPINVLRCFMVGPQGLCPFRLMQTLSCDAGP